MNFNVDFDIAAIVIWLFIIFCIFFKKILNKTSNKIFLCIILTGFVASVADAIGSVGNSHPYHHSFFYLDFWNYTFLSVHNVTSYLFAMYIIYMLGINYRLSKRKFVIVSIPIAATLLALLSNPLVHGVFYYNEDRIYSHGPFICLLYADAFIYVVLSIFMIIKYRGALTKVKYLVLLLFAVCSAVPIVIQLFYPELLIELFFQSLGMLGIMISIESQDEIVNSITKVYNRFAFLRDVGIAIKAGNHLQILTVKIPSASYYNTAIGITSMNDIMREIAEYLNSVDADISCYDCENGHFAFIIYRRSQQQVRNLGAEIKRRFESEWITKDLRIIFPAQLCIIQIPTEADTLERLLMMVDAPYENSSGESEFIASGEFGAYHREIIIEKLIKKALKDGTFQVWYQPIWDREHNCVHSAEALIRLIDDELGFISPEEFIPIAEKNGTIIDIGIFVFEEVCKLYTEQKLQNMGIEYIEVNLSVVQCMHRKLIDSFDRIMKKYELDTSRINLEITESAATSNQKALKETVLKLKDKGFSFSLDDYGTGYSNYSYMIDMPFYIIKIDKSILWRAMNPKTSEEDKNAMVLLESTISMMQKMNYKIVVEGVETNEQRRLLESYHCDYFQGYYFSKPVPAEQFMEFVQKSVAVS